MNILYQAMMDHNKQPINIITVMLSDIINWNKKLKIDKE